MPIESSRRIRDLLSLPEAAEVLGVHRATVNDMVKTGRLAGYRLGPHWFIHRDDLEAFARQYVRPKNVPRRRTRNWSERWQAEIVRWLALWHTATADELARVIDLHVGNVRKYLTLCEQDGFAERDDEGYWTLTEMGSAWAARLPTAGREAS